MPRCAHRVRQVFLRRLRALRGSTGRQGKGEDGQQPPQTRATAVRRGTRSARVGGDPAREHACCHRWFRSIGRHADHSLRSFHRCLQSVEASPGGNEQVLGKRAIPTARRDRSHRRRGDSDPDLRVLQPQVKIVIDLRVGEPSLRSDAPGVVAEDRQRHKNPPARVNCRRPRRPATATSTRVHRPRSAVSRPVRAAPYRWRDLRTDCQTSALRER